MADDDVFDYQLSMAQYMSQVWEHFDEDSDHSDAVIKRTINLIKSGTTRLHRNYEVQGVKGREVLIEKRKSTVSPIVQVLTYEDVYTIFMKHHIENDHNGGAYYLLQIEKGRYKFPELCLELLVNNCNVCQSKTEKPDENLSKICSVYVTVMIQHREYPDFRYVLIYVDKATSFVVIRPLQKKCSLEITLELFKILMQFGPPEKLLLCGYNMVLYEKIAESIKQLCPMFNFTIEFEQEDFGPTATVVEKLQHWSKQTRSAAWEIGCSIVQRHMNLETKIKFAHGDIPIVAETYLDTPHNLFYRKLVNPHRRKLQDKQNKTKDTQKKNTEKQPRKQNFNQIKDVDAAEIIELSIPSPENYKDDPLRQLGFDELNMAETIYELDEFGIENEAPTGMDCGPIIKTEIEAEIAKEIEELNDECEEVLDQTVKSISNNLNDSMVLNDTDVGLHMKYPMGSTEISDLERDYLAKESSEIKPEIDIEEETILPD